MQGYRNIWPDLAHQFLDYKTVHSTLTLFPPTLTRLRRSLLDPKVLRMYVRDTKISFFLKKKNGSSLKDVC